MSMQNAYVQSIAAVLTLVAVGAANPASAQTRGEAREERRQAREEAGPVSRTDEVSTARGKITRKIESDIDSENGRAVRSRTLTNADGQSVGLLGELNRTADGYSATQTLTDAEGKTAGRTFTQSVEEGSLSRERNAYSRNGESATANDTIERTDSGASRSREFATSTGRGGAANTDVEHEGDTATYSRTVTNAAGETVATRESSVSRTDDGVSRTTTVSDGEDE